MSRDHDPERRLVGLLCTYLLGHRWVTHRYEASGIVRRCRRCHRREYHGNGGIDR